MQRPLRSLRVCRTLRLKQSRHEVLIFVVAAMSRPVAGVRRQTLILTLPGSPKGAKENLQSVLKLLPHACRQAAGADSRVMHIGGVEKLEIEAGLESVAGSSFLSQ